MKSSELLAWLILGLTDPLFVPHGYSALHHVPQRDSWLLRSWGTRRAQQTEAKRAETSTVTIKSVAEHRKQMSTYNQSSQELPSFSRRGTGEFASGSIRYQCVAKFRKINWAVLIGPVDPQRGGGGSITQFQNFGGLVPGCMEADVLHLNSKYM